MAAPLKESNRSFFHSNPNLSPQCDPSQGNSKTKRFKSVSSVIPEPLLLPPSQKSDSLGKSPTSSLSSPLFKYQSILNENSPLKGKERLYIGKPLQKISKRPLSEDELEEQIYLARSQAEEKQVGELFEQGVSQLLRQLRTIDLLEKFYISSPYPQAFIQGFIKIELHHQTLFQTLISFIHHEVKQAKSPMHFRGNHFCIVVFQTHYSIKFTPELEQLRKTALKLRMTKIPKSSLGQLTTTHPAFLPILREVMREIYQSFDTFSEGFVYLLQVRFQSAYQYFPDEALKIAGDLFFLRILNPYLTHPNGLDPNELKDIVQISRGIQKVVNGEYFEKCEGDVEPLNFGLTELIKNHRAFINQRLAPYYYF